MPDAGASSAERVLRLTLLLSFIAMIGVSCTAGSAAHRPVIEADGVSIGVSSSDADSIAEASSISERVSIAAGCASASTPVDVLQSPYPVAATSCGTIADGGVDIFLFGNPLEKSYVLASTYTEAFTSYLVGSNWVIVGQTAIIQRLREVLGGSAFDSAHAAIDDNPAPEAMARLTTCQQFATGAVIDYVAYGSDAIAEVNSILPGLKHFFDSVLRARVRGLPSFGKSDPARSAEELIPFANDFRSGCRVLAA